MNRPHTPSAQLGAALTLEYSILMIMGGISAMGLTILLAGQLPETVMGWYETLIDSAEGAFNDYNDNWCNQAAIATLATNEAITGGFLDDPQDLMAPKACGVGPAADNPGPSWTDVTES